MGDIAAVLKQLQEERSLILAELRQLDEAIRALNNVGVRAGKKDRIGRKYTPRTMSASARRRIAAAQRARWAKFRSKRKVA
jgi:hypothetical protein